jgi:hypothetical protein
MPSAKWILTTAVAVPLSSLAGGGAFLARCSHTEVPPLVQQDQASQRPAADDQVTLQWRFEQDKPFYQEMTTITRQDMLFLAVNSNGVYGHEQTLYFSWTPVGRDKDSNWVLKQKVEAVRFVFRDADGKKTYEYDSRKDPGGVPTMVAHYCKQFVGSEFTLTFGQDGKVQRDKDRDDLMKRLEEYQPALQSHEVQVLSDAALRQSAEILLNPLNPKPVRPGDSWTWIQTLNLRPLGNIESRYRFSLGRSEGKLIRIDVESTLEGKKLQGKDKELKGNGTGTILFDPDKGRIVSEELDLRLEGKIDFVSNGMRLVPARDPAELTHEDVKLKQRQKITVKTSDTNLAELKGE